MSSDRKYLLRGTSDGPSMRNLPLFGFLAGMVFLFYVFYVYQAQSTEYNLTQAELKEHKEKLRAVKLDIINAKADLERLRSSEISLKEELDKITEEKKTCSASLRTCMLNSDQAASEKKKLTDEARNKDEKLSSLEKELNGLTAKNEELKRVVTEHEGNEKKLQEELNRVKEELEKLKVNNEKSVSTQNQQGGLSESTQGSKVEADQANAAAATRREDDQAPAPVAERAEGQEPLARPQQPGDRVKLAVAANELQQHQEPVLAKPVVKGGDYDDKLEADKGVGDDGQSV